MLEYIKGILVASNPEKVVIDVNGMGYALFTPFNVHTLLPQIGEKVVLYVASVIREQFHRHFGFLTVEERDLFEKVSEISGIGPKIALALIGHLERGVLDSAIIHSNIPLLCKIPGIGKRTAERLIVEMRGKMGKTLGQAVSTHEPSPPHRDATNALVTLGYTPSQANQAVKGALASFDSPPPLSDLIKVALKGMNP